MLDLPLAIGFQQKKNEKENEIIEETDIEDNNIEDSCH
jgi:hypothetical protein